MIASARLGGPLPNFLGEQVMAHLKSVIAAAALAALPTTLYADDYPFVAEALPPHLAERAAIQSGQLLVGDFANVQQFFIASLKVWNTAQPIRVCFFGGPAQLRSRIVQIASQWTTLGGYVPLDFGNPANPRSCTTSEFSQVRVGFAYKGYWSMVGTDSVNLAAQYEQSMNFALYDINPPAEPTFSRVVLHEFGHALGFQHEHQSQTSPCASEFNWDAIYAYLQGPPNYWSIEQIDHNLRPLNEPGDVSSPFDNDSIMLYSFPASFYKAGTGAQCYTPGNNVISQVDVDAILRFYPAGVADQAKVQQDALQDYFATVDALPEVSVEAKSFAKLTASSLSQSPGTFSMQSLSPWSQNAPVFFNSQNKPVDVLDFPALYLNPPPKL